MLHIIEENHRALVTDAMEVLSLPVFELDAIKAQVNDLAIAVHLVYRYIREGIHDIANKLGFHYLDILRDQTRNFVFLDWKSLDEIQKHLPRRINMQFPRLLKNLEILLVIHAEKRREDLLVAFPEFFPVKQSREELLLLVDQHHPEVLVRVDGNDLIVLSQKWDEGQEGGSLDAIGVQFLGELTGCDDQDDSVLKEQFE